MDCRRFAKRTLKVLLWIPVVVIGLVLVALAILPMCSSLLPLPTVDVDLSSQLAPEARKLFNSAHIDAKFDLRQSPRGGFLLTARGKILDFPYTLTVDADYSIFTLSADALIDFSFDGTPWRAFAKAQGNPWTWSASANLPKITFDESDPLIAPILARADLGSISDLAFSGTLDFSVSAEKTRQIPVPVWTSKGRFSNGAFSCGASGHEIVVRGARVGFAAEGIADRVMIRPIALVVQSVDAAGFSITNFYASIRKSDNAFIIDQASAGVCGGEIKAYSVYLDPAKLTGGFTVFLDDIDAEQALRQIKGFRGAASGTLHGKLPVFLKNGSELRLGNAYLYSTPGETGSLRIEDPEPFLENLRAGGVESEVCDNFSKAMRNLMYTVLKLDLKRDPDGGFALGFKIEGTASHGKTSVPVSFTCTFHGDIEQIINTGLNLKKLKK